MKYKVLAIDIDGTLVKKDNIISSKNANLIKMYTDEGGIVIFVTGRSINSAISIAGQLEKKSGYKVPFICSLNATLIFDYHKNKVISSEKISANYVGEILEFAKQNDLGFAMYTEKTMAEEKMPIYGFGKIPNFLSVFKKGTKIINWSKEDKVDGAFKINLILKTKSSRNLQLVEEIKQKFQGIIEVTRTSNWLMEITKININKEFGVKKISEVLKISLDNFAAIGDSANDLPMFKVCGLSIAARKKYPHVLRVVDKIVESNQNVAVAYAIENYILNHE